MSYCVFPQLFFIVVTSLAYIWLKNRADNKNEKTKFANTCGILLVIYASILLYLALMSRDTDTRSLSFVPFRSYATVLTEYNTFDVLRQILENILVFIPLGILFPESFQLRTGRKAVMLTVAAGASLSLIIELSQFTYAIGYAEFDDLFNNILGCSIGCGVYCFAGKVSAADGEVRIKKGAFKGLLPALLTAFSVLIIILYREAILFKS